MNQSPWQVKILTLFPDIFPGPLQYSVTGRGLKEKFWSIEAKNIRDFASDKHKTVDDIPYGGGNGMVMKADVLANAIDSFFQNTNPIIYLSPRGTLLKQTIAHDYANNYKGLNILCGRFEGIDERLFIEYKIQEISVGDYVLTCGDVAAFSLIDSCVRLIPGLLETGEALKEESFGLSPEYQNLLEYPQYTKPATWRQLAVPSVLLSGNHANINKWRLEQAELKTKTVRPDLWDLCKKGD
jgi:tRNA (guanine37-N1)-methyltransferase